MGNTRVVFNQLTPGVAQVLQLQQYYAYGMRMGDNTMNYVGTTKDLYGYNGKEEQPDQGLDWIDYGARFYDAELGRWHVVDPLAENYQIWSPYNYAMDNPIMFIDPDGMGASPIYDMNSGQFLGTDDQGFKGDILFMTKTNFEMLRGDKKIKHEDALKNSRKVTDMPMDKGDVIGKAFTDVVSQMTPNATGELHNGKLSTYEWNDDSGKGFASNNGSPVSRSAGAQTEKFGDNNYKITYNLTNKEFMTTVENVQNIFVHEFMGHGVKGIRGENKHYEAFKLQMEHPTFKQTTPAYQESVIKMSNIFRNKYQP